MWPHPFGSWRILPVAEWLGADLHEQHHIPDRAGDVRALMQDDHGNTAEPCCDVIAALSSDTAPRFTLRAGLAVWPGQGAVIWRGGKEQNVRSTDAFGSAVVALGIVCSRIPRATMRR